MRQRSPTGVTQAAALLAAALLVASPAAAQQQEPSSGNGLVNVGAFVCTLVYSPLKFAYAASGIVVGSMAWAWSFGSSAVARPIFRKALQGDYVVTSSHLRGERSLRFVGRR